MSSQDRPLLGIQAMLAATFCYTLCDAIGKWIVADHSVFMLLFIRSAAAGLIVLPMLHNMGWVGLWRLDRPWLAVGRILCATAETGLFFATVQYLSLTATLSIYLAAPLLVALLSPWFLSEVLTRAKLLGCLGGFVGVLLLLQPGTDSFEPAAIMAVFGMVALALTLLTARSLKGVEPVVLVAHQILGTLIAGGVGVLLFEQGPLPDLLDTGLMAMVGISAMLAQFFVAWSMRLAPASLVSPFFYSAMVWALLADALIWQVIPPPVALCGALLIVVSGIWLGRRSA